MEINRLRSIIRESISNNLKEIEDIAENAAMEAKLNAYTEAIEKVNKKIETAESLEEMQELVDPAKLNELKKHLKLLEKNKAKLEKLQEKKNKGKKVVTDEPVEEEAAIEEDDMAKVQAMDGAANWNDKQRGLSWNSDQLYDDAQLEEGTLNESFLKMQKLAGVITEAQYNQKKILIENQLNEDILELKQMSKQLYSFLKSKGFTPALKTELQTEKPKEIGKVEMPTQIVVTDKPDERVVVAISAESVAKAMVGGGNDWWNKAEKEFGRNITSNAMNAIGNWFTNPKIMQYVDNLGNEMLKQIFDKYPNMEYGFSKQNNFWYILTFRFKKTAKGAEVNPNQRPNAPKPSA